MPRVGTSAALGSKEAGAGGAPGAGTQCPWEQLRPQELPVVPTRALPTSSGRVSGPFLAPFPVGPQAHPPPCSWASLYLVMLLLRAVFSGSREDREFGVVRHVAQPTGLVSNFLGRPASS